MRRQLLNLGLRGTLPNHTPDNFLRDPATPDGASLVDTSKQIPTFDVRGRGPDVDGVFDPARDRNSSHMSTLANQIYDGSMFLSLLHMLHRQMN